VWNHQLHLSNHNLHLSNHEAQLCSCQNPRTKVDPPKYPFHQYPQPALPPTQRSAQREGGVGGTAFKNPEFGACRMREAIARVRKVIAQAQAVIARPREVIGHVQAAIAQLRGVIGQVRGVIAHVRETVYS
jgi:hypothetical protein